MISLFFCDLANARTKNEDLQTQFKNDPNRLLPSSDLYTVGADIDFFYNATATKQDYYHSGYWANFFGELRPMERMTVNLKLTAYDPSNSYGYTASAQTHPFFSVTYGEHFLADQVKFHVVGFDLGRRTLAGGLLVQEKEMSGLYFETSIADSVQLSWVKPGTGVFNYAGDADIFALTYKQGLLGVYGFRATLDEKDQIWHYFKGLYSTFASAIGPYYAVELSQQEKASGDLARLGFKKKLPYVHIDAALEQRRYREGLMRDFSYRLEQDYISVEDRDKQYTDPMNIFSDFDAITTRTALLSFTLMPDQLFRFSSRNEFSRWQSPELDQRPYAFDQKLLFCPYPGKDTCVDVALTNIVSNASKPIDTPDRDNKAMIKLVKHWRLEAQVFF